LWQQLVEQRRRKHRRRQLDKIAMQPLHRRVPYDEV
jgi:hypothetical protein